MNTGKLSVLTQLLDLEFTGELERNGNNIDVSVKFTPDDTMVIGPIPSEMEYGSDIAYIKFQGGSVYACASEDDEYHYWSDGEEDGVQTFRLMDPRVYAQLLIDDKLSESEPVSAHDGKTDRIFGSYNTANLDHILKMPASAFQMMIAATNGHGEVGFDFAPEVDLPMSLILRELESHEDEITVKFRYNSNTTPSNKRAKRKIRFG